jgi:transposase
MAKAAEWSLRVKEWQASGKSAREFCEGRGFSVSGLHWWSSHFKRNAAKAAKDRPRVRLARVVERRASEGICEASRGGVVGRSLVVGKSPAAVVHVGGVRIEVPRAADEATLATVFRALLGASRKGAA